ncbi:MAG: terpene cyclase/mutase family protein [Gemmataceae bacterium]|nr:terpene cyclase/mutase family protein [Gemmataceae bacterium]
MAMKGGMNSQPAAPQLIKNIPTPGDEDTTTDMRRLIPAWIISGVIHVVLLSLFLLVTVSQGQGSMQTELSVIESKVEEDVRDKNLTNDEIGNDPDLPTNYNVDRIEEVSVPGPVTNDAVGILNAPDGPPQTIPPPPGFGGSAGQGGGIDDPSRIGAGNLYGTAGGMGGPKLVPGGFGGRSGATREKMLREGGGNTRSEAAVAAGLKWLTRHQAADGHWGFNDFNVHGKCNCSGPGAHEDMAGTSLALLALQGAGETHKGVGKHSLYAKHVERALAWMKAKQNGDGVFSGNGYVQGMATVAICEAYGLTADPQLKGPAQRAIQAVVNWQGPDGGFRYGPKQAGDTSVHGWHVQALKSGQMSGLNVPNATLAGVNNFLEKVSTPDGSGCGYTGPQPTPRMTAVGLLCRQYMGWGPRNPGLSKGVETLRKLPPANTHKDMYYYYYATQVVHHMGGAAWDEWNPKMRDMLIDSQDQGQNADRRDQKGSWDSAGDAFGGQFGRLGITCLSLLTLEVYYRHLPLYRRELGAAKEEAVKNGL